MGPAVLANHGELLQSPLSHPRLSVCPTACRKWLSSPCPSPRPGLGAWSAHAQLGPLSFQTPGHWTQDEEAVGGARGIPPCRRNAHWEPRLSPFALRPGRSWLQAAVLCEVGWLAGPLASTRRCHSGPALGQSLHARLDGPESRGHARWRLLPTPCTCARERAVRVLCYSSLHSPWRLFTNYGFKERQSL